MKNTLVASLFITSLLMLSCQKSSAPPSLEGAWLGEGVFSADSGELAVKAQLEILSDGSYRFLILEPRLLMLTGVESGKWIKEGTMLTLQPVKEKPGNKGEREAVFAKLRKSSPENFRLKKLVMAEDFSRLGLVNGPMHLEFRPNSEATRKLKEAGEVK